MSSVIKDSVKYTLKNNFYIVGDNTTTEANGITDQSYSGTITIPAKINNSEVKEIGQYSFYKCKSLTKVYIFAQIISINYRAFHYCMCLEYVNIPSTVTLICNAFCLNNADGKAPSLPMTVEFEPGRTQKVAITYKGFYARQTFYIIYPSVIPPIFTCSDAFYLAITVNICAPKKFTFGNKETTIDMTKCPTPKYKNVKFFTINKIEEQTKVLLASLMIIICARSW